MTSAFDLWLLPPDPHECPWCEDDPTMDYEACEARAWEALEDAAIDRADSIRKGEW